MTVQSWDVASDLEPLDVRGLMHAERAALLRLLRDLEPELWTIPTACPGWDVRDIALHLLGGDAARLSFRRDGNRSEAAGDDLDYVAMAQLIDEENDLWVRATRRLSPRVLLGLLRLLGDELDAYLRTLDPWEVGASVAWSGTGPTPNWLDVAREYTERWIHQQQIRDAVGRPGLVERKWLHPVLDTFMRCLPRAYDGQKAPPGTSVLMTVEGGAGGRWALVRETARWRLVVPESVTPAAEVSLPVDLAWRLLARMISPREASGGIRLTGDRQLGLPATEAVAIMHSGG